MLPFLIIYFMQMKVLISPFANTMYTLLDICQEFADENDILYNAKKSKCMLFHLTGYVI